MADKQEVLQKVQEILTDALGVDEEEVAEDASLVADLGAESIDFLDIVFRLEKTFNIKIPRGDLFPEDLLSDEQYVQEGKITPEGLKVLKEKVPYADLNEFEKNPDVSGVANLFTVGMIVSYVTDRLAS
ncbi:MAG: acyl carrier protein [Planctomycetes bacterium DG_23]|nr:MAG: acyl carrier protein [Planctomycetes bacterium DG_23]